MDGGGLIERKISGVTRTKDYDPKDEQDSQRPRFDPSLLSPEELNLVEMALRLMVKATRTPGEPVEIEQGLIEPDDGRNPRK